MQESQTWVGDQGHKHVDDVNIIRDLITAGCRKQAREGASKINLTTQCVAVDFLVARIVVVCSR